MGYLPELSTACADAQRTVTVHSSHDHSTVNAARKSGRQPTTVTLSSRSQLFMSRPPQMLCHKYCGSRKVLLRIKQCRITRKETKNVVWLKDSLKAALWTYCLYIHHPFVLLRFVLLACKRQIAFSSNIIAMSSGTKPTLLRSQGEERSIS